ncbi:MAG: hypothetical protein U0176_00160 [Bacteroidia bacterium]
MKKSFVLLLFALCIGIAASAQSETPTFEPIQDIKTGPYIIPKLELPGSIVQLALIPSHIHPSYHDTFNPLPIAGTVEVGIGKKSAAILGLGFRYGKNRAWFGPNNSGYWTGKFNVFRLLVAYRYYFKDRGGRGFYTQPTAKVVSGRTTQFYANATESKMNIDFIISNRIGLQMKLWRGLFLDGSLGVGLGFRSEENFFTYNWGYFYNTAMDEISFLDTQIIWGWGRKPTVSIVGDGSLALGWRF